MNLKEMSDKQREIANALFDGKEYLCVWQKNDPFADSCMTREENRPLTKKQKEEGRVHRGFAEYDTEKMCNNCRAYWFAEMAAQQLHHIHCCQARAEALDNLKALAAK